jgi:hypothetical protein
MNRNGRIAFYLIFVSAIVINITTLVNGAQKHETWRIVTGSISLSLMLIAGVIVLINARRQKSKQLS